MSTGGVRQLVRWSLWHDALQYIAQDWQRIVGPGLRVVIHPDSQLGDESNMLRKARGAIIDAVGLSSVGLSRIESGVSPFRVPMMLESYRGTRLRTRTRGGGPGAPHRVHGFQVLPYSVIVLAVVLLITYVPALTLWLVHLLEARGML